MATLVLTTIGTAVGGPIGGAIGAVIGQQVDQRIFPARRRGARLGALTVQTSAYGQPIPRLFGTLRVAGTVIWATDLHENRSRSSGGKGKPSGTTYSYSASFAVALSGRPIRAVHRIWADGKLLRGAAGDWKSETGFRLHTGGEAQAVDPLLAAAEGLEGTPAYRGLAYAVFEDLQLADFGNRIPSLTFEVEADATAVPIGQIAAELSTGAVSGDTMAALSGYAASGDSVRGAIETLARAIPLSVRDDGVRLALADVAPSAIAIPPDELGAVGEGAARAGRRAIDRAATGTLPDEVSVTYYEPARDYQAGLQRARRGGAARRIETIELAAALDAGMAKAVAERRLADVWAARTTARAFLPWRRLDVRPGDALVLQDGDCWRIAGWTLENMVLGLRLRATRPGMIPVATANPGRATGAADEVHGPTTLALLDLPTLDDNSTTPRLWLAAAGKSSGWRRAGVITSSDGGESWTDAGSTAAPAVIGVALDSLAAGDAVLFDHVTSVEISLLHDAMTLISRDNSALAGGANLAMLGDELFQFGRAEALGERRWRLSRLLRGRRGTEDAMYGHAAGDRFVLIDPVSLLPLEMSVERIGSTLRVIASGVGDTVGVETGRIALARALRPPAPVHLRATPIDGGLSFVWTRRSRSGWSWTDGGDVPLVEEAERYRLTITASDGTHRQVEVERPAYTHEAAGMPVGGSGDSGWLAIDVVQIGTFGASPSASARFNIYGERA